MQIVTYVQEESCYFTLRIITLSVNTLKVKIKSCFLQNNFTELKLNWN